MTDKVQKIISNLKDVLNDLDITSPHRLPIIQTIEYLQEEPVSKWQKVNLWKDAQGDDLPEIDREVIVLYQPYPCEGNEYVVGFAHRPKEYWDGRNIETDEVTRYYPKRYDKGGWNIPDVKWWLDSNIEKLNNNEKEEI